jgi:MoaA/NifB/PqqE/SkfB family radical SAM enzyme
MCAQSFKSMYIQTNATTFKSQENIPKIIRDDVSYFVSFPSHIREVYNEITKSSLYDDAVQGISNISQNNVVNLNIVLSKKNYKHLDKIIDFAYITFQHKNIQITLSNIGYTESKKEIFKDYIVDFSKIKEKISLSLELGRERNIEVSVIDSGDCGFPLCVAYAKGVRHIRNIISSEKNQTFVQPQICSSCRYRNQCSGISKHYLKIYGTSGITPFQ